MRFIKLLINIYISKSLMAYHQLLFAPIPPFLPLRFCLAAKSRVRPALCRAHRRFAPPTITLCTPERPFLCTDLAKATTRTRNGPFWCTASSAPLPTLRIVASLLQFPPPIYTPKWSNGPLGGTLGMKIGPKVA